MSIFEKLLSNYRRQSGSQKQNKKSLGENSFGNLLTADDGFYNLYTDPFNDAFLCNAWVNIAVNILVRNIARADFVLEREGVELKSGPSIPCSTSQTSI